MNVFNVTVKITKTGRTVWKLLCLGGQWHFLGIGGNSEGDEEWLDTRNTLKIKLTALVDSLYKYHKSK